MLRSYRRVTPLRSAGSLRTGVASRRPCFFILRQRPGSARLQACSGDARPLCSPNRLGHLWTFSPARLRAPSLAVFVCVLILRIWSSWPDFLMGAALALEHLVRVTVFPAPALAAAIALLGQASPLKQARPQQLPSPSLAARVPPTFWHPLLCRCNDCALVRWRLLGLDVGPAGCRSDAFRADGGHRGFPLRRTRDADMASALPTLGDGSRARVLRRKTLRKNGWGPVANRGRDWLRGPVLLYR